MAGVSSVSNSTYSQMASASPQSVYQKSYAGGGQTTSSIATQVAKSQAQAATRSVAVNQRDFSATPRTGGGSSTRTADYSQAAGPSPFQATPPAETKQVETFQEMASKSYSEAYALPKISEPMTAEQQIAKTGGQFTPIPPKGTTTKGGATSNIQSFSAGERSTSGGTKTVPKDLSNYNSVTDVQGVTRYYPKGQDMISARQAENPYITGVWSDKYAPPATLPMGSSIGATLTGSVRPSSEFGKDFITDTSKVPSKWYDPSSGKLVSTVSAAPYGMSESAAQSRGFEKVPPGMEDYYTGAKSVWYNRDTNELVSAERAPGQPEGLPPGAYKLNFLSAGNSFQLRDVQAKSQGWQKLSPKDISIRTDSTGAKYISGNIPPPSLESSTPTQQLGAISGAFALGSSAGTAIRNNTKAQPVAQTKENYLGYLSLQGALPTQAQIDKEAADYKKYREYQRNLNTQLEVQRQSVMNNWVNAGVFGMANVAKSALAVPAWAVNSAGAALGNQGMGEAASENYRGIEATSNLLASAYLRNDAEMSKSLKYLQTPSASQVAYTQTYGVPAEEQEAYKASFGTSTDKSILGTASNSIDYWQPRILGGLTNWEVSTEWAMGRLMQNKAVEAEAERKIAVQGVQLNRIEDPSQRTATILWKAATEGIGIPVTAYYGAKVIPGIISGSTRATASGAATLLSKESIGILPRSAAAIQTAGGAIVAGGIIGGSAVMGYQAAVDLSDKAAFGASTGNYAPFVGTTSVLGGYLAGAVAAGYTTKAAAAREKAGIKPKEMIEGTLELPNGDVYIPKETIPKSPAIKTRIIKGAPAVERYLSQNSDMMDNLNFRRSSFFKENFPKEWAESNGNMAGVTVRNILDGNKARIFINSDMPRGEADVLLRGILSHNDKAINALKNVPSSWTDAIRTEFPFENPYQYSDTGQLMTQKSAIKHEILHVLNPSLDDATQAGIAAMKAMERMPLKIEVPASGYGTMNNVRFIPTESWTSKLPTFKWSDLKVPSPYMIIERVSGKFTPIGEKIGKLEFFEAMGEVSEGKFIKAEIKDNSVIKLYEKKEFTINTGPKEINPEIGGSTSSGGMGNGGGSVGTGGGGTSKGWSGRLRGDVITTIPSKGPPVSVVNIPAQVIKTADGTINVPNKAYVLSDDAALRIVQKVIDRRLVDRTTSEALKNRLTETTIATTSWYGQNIQYLENSINRITQFEIIPKEQIAKTSEQTFAARPSRRKEALEELSRMSELDRQQQQYLEESKRGMARVLKNINSGAAPKAPSNYALKKVAELESTFGGIGDMNALTRTISQGKMDLGTFTTIEAKVKGTTRIAEGRSVPTQIRLKGTVLREDILNYGKVPLEQTEIGFNNAIEGLSNAPQPQRVMGRAAAEKLQMTTGAVKRTGASGLDAIKAQIDAGMSSISSRFENSAIGRYKSQKQLEVESKELKQILKNIPDLAKMAETRKSEFVQKWSSEYPELGARLNEMESLSGLISDLSFKLNTQQKSLSKMTPAGKSYKELKAEIDTNNMRLDDRIRRIKAIESEVKLNLNRVEVRLEAEKRIAANNEGKNAIQTTSDQQRLRIQAQNIRKVNDINRPFEELFIRPQNIDLIAQKISKDMTSNMNPWAIKEQLSPAGRKTISLKGAVKPYANKPVADANLAWKEKFDAGSNELRRMLNEADEYLLAFKELEFMERKYFSANQIPTPRLQTLIKEALTVERWNSVERNALGRDIMQKSKGYTPSSGRLESWLKDANAELNSRSQRLADAERASLEKQGKYMPEWRGQTLKEDVASLKSIFRQAKSGKEPIIKKVSAEIPKRTSTQQPQYSTEQDYSGLSSGQAQTRQSGQGQQLQQVFGDVDSAYRQSSQEIAQFNSRLIKGSQVSSRIMIEGQRITRVEKVRARGERRPESRGIIEAMNDGFKSAVFATSIRPVQRQGSVGAFEYSPMQGQVRAVGYTQTQQPIRVVTTDTLQIIVPTYEQITRPVTTERPAPIVPVAPTAPTGTKRAPFVPLLPPLGGMGSVELGGMDSSYLTATRFVNNYVPSIPELVRYF